MPGYRLDTLGNLIRCDLASYVEGSLISGACKIVSSREDLQHPLAWTLTVEAVEARIISLVALKLS